MVLSRNKYWEVRKDLDRISREMTILYEHFGKVMHVPERKKFETLLAKTKKFVQDLKFKS